MRINGLSCGHKHVVLLYSPACLVRKTRSDRLHRNPILILFRTLARRMGLLILRRVAWLLVAPEPADPALVCLGPGGDFTRYWPERPPQKRIVNGTRVVNTPLGFPQGVLDPWPHK